jgi:cullin-4
MQPPEDISLDNIVSTNGSASKRKLSDQQKKPSPSKATHSSISTTASPPASKRLKTSHSSGNLGRSTNTDMSKVMVRGAGPNTIDLTRPSNFQPNTGAKRLVIKNLRTSSRKDIDTYYDRTWDELDAALTSVFSRTPPTSPLEVLCRGVEAICRRGQPDKLFTHLKDRCKASLEKQLLPTIENEAGPNEVGTLRTVHKFWTIWNEQSVSYIVLLLLIVLANIAHSDPSAINIQLPRPILFTERQRPPSPRRPSYPTIPPCGFHERQSKKWTTAGRKGGIRHVRTRSAR